MKLKKENKKGKVIHNKRKDFHARNFARVTEQLGNGLLGTILVFAVAFEMMA